MKKYLFKSLALTLSILLSIGVFAGCNKNNTPSDSSDFVNSDDSDDDFFVYDPNNTDSNSDDSGKQTSGGKNNNSSGKNNNSGSTSGGSTNNTDRLAVFKNMPAKLRGTTVTFAQWGDEGGERYRKLAQKFTNDYGIKVKWVDYNEENYPSEILTQIAANNGPDIVVCNSDFPSIVETTQELPSYFNLNDGFWDKRITDKLQVKGKYYYVNSYTSPYINTQLIFYNKKIFSSKGITTPDEYYSAGKWTYENFVKCMENVTKAGYTGALINTHLSIAQHMGGRDIFTYDPKTATFTADTTNSVLVDAVQFVAECADKGLSKDYANFANGQVGMVVNSVWGLKYNGYLKKMAPSDIGVVPMPSSYKGKQLSSFVSGTRAYGIAKNAKNPEGAYYFLRYYLDYANYQDAGVNIFANKKLEKFYVETVMPKYKNDTVIVCSYASGLTKLTGNTFYTWVDPWRSAFQAAAGQVTTELAKLQGLCANQAKLGTERLKKAG